jgi:uncharacterized membrane protein
MGTGWAHMGTSIIASFLASLVECVEALTVVLAVGSVRGWRSALTGTATAIAVLLIIIAALGTALAHIPLPIVQLVVGTLLLLFGLRWLRKAILRSAGQIPLHDEQAAFNITMLEGTEVVFIVIAIGAGRTGMLLPASLGAVAALLVVIALGLILHRPLARIPENTLKFIVGVLLSAFGTFWVGEGLHLEWPGADWSIPALIAAYLVLALAIVPLCRSRSRTVSSNTRTPA